MKSTVSDDVEMTAPTKRGRGRPRKDSYPRVETTEVINIGRGEKRGRPRFQLPPMPRIEKGEKAKLSITFPLDKDCLAKTEFENIYFLYPKLSQFPCMQLGDSNNPRQHNLDCLKNVVMREANETLIQNPENFHLINRGLTILAHSFEYKNGKATITVTNSNEGTADGASTETLIARAQRLTEQVKERNATLPPEEQEEVPDYLERGRLRIELIIGIKDHDLIASVVSARNSSRPVKNFSMANFSGLFQFIKDETERDDSPFRGRIAFEENGTQDTSILHVLALMNLFHPDYNTSVTDDGKLKAPVISYSNKGQLPTRLENEELLKGYQSLIPILPKILSLSEYVYANFETAYSRAFGGKVKLGRRKGFTSKQLDEEKVDLPLTGLQSNYRIENGILYPLLGAFRSLVAWKNGKAGFKRDPQQFFDKYGPRLINHLIEELESESTPNKLGKSARSYIALSREVSLILAKEESKED